VQWDGTGTAGFTTGEPWIGIAGNHTWINAQAEATDPDSVLSFFKRLIELRKAERVVQTGDVRFVDVASDKVIAYERTLGDVRLLVQCNYSGDEQPAVAADGGEVLISNYAEPGDGATLRPWEATARIWR
jgi:glycosidase